MGSFCDLVLAFDFRKDTPPEVLAAFAALERPLPDGAFHGPAPDLPAPVVEPDEWWEVDWRETGEHDEFETEPWRHDRALPLSSSMSVSTVPLAALSWSEMGRWNLSCRCSFKTWAMALFEALEWLGPFVEDWQTDQSLLLGYIDDDADARPHLLWVRAGKLSIEDLNGGA